MATANITMSACTGASDSMKVYYGKTLIATGTPLSGTGWTLYSGAPIAPSTTVLLIPGLDDNVQYTFYRYCHCPISGDTDPEVIGPEIKYACPSFQSTTSTSTQIDYIITIPSSANNSGTWISKILVELYDSTGTTLFATNTHNSPFSSAASGSFLGLIASTDYRLKIKYSNSSGTVTHECTFQDVETKPPCVAPTVSSGNITYNSFEVVWSVPASFSGDTYNIVINSSTIASGLTIGSSPYLVTGLNPSTIYSVQVVRNCGFGGTASSTPINITTEETPIVPINGSIIITCGDVGCTQQGPVRIQMSFNDPTPAPITFYFAAKFQSGPGIVRSGYEIIPGGLLPGESNQVTMTPPSSTCGSIDLGPQAYKIDVPQGVTSFDSNTIPSAGGLCTSGQIYRRTICFASGGACLSTWVCHSCLSPIKDLYVKVSSPSGYIANFSLSSSSNPSGIVIHNVP